ncbi:MAG: peptide deformylase [Bacilli bacterium]|jgi:peptide deformylase|nr:peptide deformylase [Bacilli bacterium]MDD2681343.1 peptide deformylase [Bacilli bacterium]MDD3120852.1 peptide deformylase [Bacilli bacterium]MDY0363251.1 peptide deformylase [Bacilli bacterium]
MILYKDIIKEDHPDLRIPSKEVSLPLSDEDIKTLELMNEYLLNGYDEEKTKKYGIRPGVGLSAVQIDVLKRMFIIMAYDEKGVFHHYAVINPKIISESIELTYLKSGEGCLSVDRQVDGLIFRPRRIKANVYLYDFLEKKVTYKQLKLKDYLAIIFQHEYDHLKGILFVDRINKENPFLILPNSVPVTFESQED